MPQTTASTARRYTVPSSSSEGLTPASRFGSPFSFMCPSRCHGVHVFPSGEASTSIDLNDIVRPPCLAEERLRWAVEAQIREPTFAGDGLNPVLFFSLWGLRAEVDVHRPIGVRHGAAVLTDT